MTIPDARPCRVLAQLELEQAQPVMFDMAALEAA
jgi:hypothetical protein